MIYDRTSISGFVNYTRKQLFTQKGRTLENIPPTHDVLMQHSKHSAYQAGHVWSPCLLTDPGNCGSTIIIATIVDHAANSCRLMSLLRCACRTGCKTRLCKCIRAKLRCSALCRCGHCENTNGQ